MRKSQSKGREINKKKRFFHTTEQIGFSIEINVTTVNSDVDTGEHHNNITKVKHTHTYIHTHIQYRYEYINCV